MSRTVLRNATICPVSGSDALELIPNGAIVIEDERIAWVGPERDLPSTEGAGEINCRGRLVTPGLIDCHTHLVYDGNRADEFEMRLSGASYEEISRAGGGILSSVAATEVEYARYQDSQVELNSAVCATTERAAIEKSETPNSVAEQRRFNNQLAQGITTVEVKSGYGVRAETEAFLPESCGITCAAR